MVSGVEEIDKGIKKKKVCMIKVVLQLVHLAGICTKWEAEKCLVL
jgi:hypothetical protein